MNQKEFEDKLDEYASKLSGAVSEGVTRLEETFERQKQKMSDNEKLVERERRGGSSKMGVLLLVLGILWLLNSVGAFHQPIFPVIMIIVGVFFIARNRS